MLQHGFGRHRSQIELQTARQHRHRHFLWIRRRQHEFEVFRRLFQRFQHRVERGVGQHVHLVNHEDFEAPLHRFVNRLLQQCLHLVHTTIRRRIQLGIVHKPAAINIPASLANPTRRSGDAALPVSALAVQRLGQNPRNRRLPHPPRAGEHVSMVQPLSRQRIGQSLHHVLLPHQLGEVFRAVFAGENQIRHKLGFYGVF